MIPLGEGIANRLCSFMPSLILLLLLLLVYPIPDVFSTLSKSDRKPKQKPVEPTSEKDENQYPSDAGQKKRQSALAMKIDESQKIEILQSYSQLDITERKFSGPVTLGYVTPWNNHGYDVAKWAAKKFSHISPVWFQLRSVKQKSKEYSCEITGTHDIDKGWMEDIRKNNSATKILPRMLFEGWSAESLESLLSNRRFQENCAEFVASFLMENEMDGVVFEIWLQVMAMTRGTAAENLLSFLELFAQKLKNQERELTLILPLTPPLNSDLQPLGIVSPGLIPRLSNAVDFINLMTYDYPSREIAGVAPLNWVEVNLRYIIEQGADPSKVLMGVNFYGYDRTEGKNEAILGPKFIELLFKPDSMIVYDPLAEEYRVEFGPNGVAYFPTTKSLKKRLELAEELNLAGFGIWELGQGLDYFTKIL